MADSSSVEFDHCRDLALVPGSVFEFTSRFLPAGKLEPLMALYALSRAISTVPHGHSDDSVKWTKLKWWSEELIAEPDAPLRHPVLRALWQLGAREYLGNPLLLRMVGDALSEIDVVPDANEKDLFERQSALGATEILLELALDNAEIDEQSLDCLGAAMGTFRLISRFSAGQVSETARLPLSLLAKYNVSAQQLEQQTHTDELAQIIEQLAEFTLDWYSKGLTGLKMGQSPAAFSHLRLRWAMEERRLKVIRNDAHGFLQSGKHFGPADAWFAWRFLRKLG
jgi:phytoene/squalene synthetase